LTNPLRPFTGYNKYYDREEDADDLAQDKQRSKQERDNT